MQILTPEEIRATEDKENAAGLSYEKMMENAGRGCALHILKNYPKKKNILIICGKGKNGGDGFVIARHLRNAGKHVNVLCAFNSPSDELSQKNRQLIDGVTEITVLDRLSDKIRSLTDSADIIIDAVFGIGFKGNLPENIKELFSYINSSCAVKIAIDIPSGLSVTQSNTDECFTADETLSMLCYKHEHILKPFCDKCGKTTVIPIGFDCPVSRFHSASKNEIMALLPRRPYNSNKGTFGKALIIAGSYKMPGAAIIATEACLSSGAGLTVLAFPDRIYNTVTSHLTECVFRPVSSDENGGFSENAFSEITEAINSFDAVAIGPGLSVSKNTEKLVYSVIKSYKGKLIIDADGINIISRNIDILKESEADILLTPHPMEMSRLTGKSIAEINNNREVVATDFAEKYGVCLLLKGANTVIASPGGRTYINPVGSSALSRGGSGDMLTGIAVSLAASGADITETGVLAAYIHGLAGETAEKKYTAYASTVKRINDCIPDALSIILSGK